MGERFDPELERLVGLVHRVWESAILIAAVELDFFTILHDGPLSAGEIASRASLDEKGVRIVLDALCPLQLIEKRAGRYALTETAARHLDSRSEHYAGPIFWGAIRKDRWEAWGRIADAVRHGGPVVKSSRPPEEYFRGLVKMISYPADHAASLLADHLGIGAKGKCEWSILDVACGSGRYGLKLLERDSSARLTMTDLKQVLEIALDEAEKRNLASRVETIPGDFFEISLPRAEFDLILLSHFLHSHGPEKCREIIKKLAAAQKTVGYLVIHEFVPDEQRCSKRYPLLFAMNMYISNGVGDSYTYSEIKGWLEEAGYYDVQLLDTPGRSSFVFGHLR